jgi:1-acyl-sn-glycerol-3-phosphate acyltransferase
MKVERRNKRPFLYVLIRAIVKTAIDVFFQRVELRHAEHIPESGPVVFVANHPNSIMDALVLGLITRRQVHYLGHAGLFSGRLKSWFLKSCGVIPVHRRTDVSDAAVKNLDAFEACYEVLGRGQTIGIFPEGTSDILRKVKKIKTGAARIALEAERRTEYKLDLKIIPVGLYFFSRSRFRSKVLLNVGAPLDWRYAKEMNKEDNYEAVFWLTNRIQKRLEELTVNVHHEELDDFVHDVEQLYSDEIRFEEVGIPHEQGSAIGQFVLTQKIAECINYYYDSDPERILELRERVDHYKRKLKRLHINDAMLRERPRARDMARSSTRILLHSAWGLLPALYGVVNNFAPYFIAENIASRYVHERTKILSALLIGGVLAFLIFYSLQLLLVAIFVGNGFALLYLATLPASGFFALHYLKQLRDERNRFNVSFFIFTNRHLFNKMRRERSQLMSQMNAIKDEYLAVIRRTGGAGLMEEKSQ